MKFFKIQLSAVGAFLSIALITTTLNPLTPAFAAGANSKLQIDGAAKLQIDGAAEILDLSRQILQANGPTHRTRFATAASALATYRLMVEIGLSHQWTKVSRNQEFQLPLSTEKGTHFAVLGTPADVIERLKAEVRSIPKSELNQPITNPKTLQAKLTAIDDITRDPNQYRIGQRVVIEDPYQAIRNTMKVLTIPIVSSCKTVSLEGVACVFKTLSKDHHVQAPFLSTPEHSPGGFRFGPGLGITELTTGERFVAAAWFSGRTSGLLGGIGLWFGENVPPNQDVQNPEFQMGRDGRYSTGSHTPVVNGANSHGYFVSNQHEARTQKAPLDIHGFGLSAFYKGARKIKLFRLYDLTPNYSEAHQTLLAGSLMLSPIISVNSPASEATDAIAAERRGLESTYLSAVFNGYLPVPTFRNFYAAPTDCPGALDKKK